MGAGPGLDGCGGALLLFAAAFERALQNAALRHRCSAHAEQLQPVAVVVHRCQHDAGLEPQSSLMRRRDKWVSMLRDAEATMCRPHTAS